MWALALLVVVRPGRELSLPEIRRLLWCLVLRVPRGSWLSRTGTAATSGRTCAATTVSNTSNCNKCNVNGNGVSVEMSVRLSQAFGSTPETWLGMQTTYDLRQVRERTKHIEVENFQTAAPS